MTLKIYVLAIATVLNFLALFSIFPPLISAKSYEVMAFGVIGLFLFFFTFILLLRQLIRCIKEQINEEAQNENP